MCLSTIKKRLSSWYSSSVNGTNGRFDEMVQYNSHGTITSLQRNGMRNNGTYGIIDDLTINYDGNRLLSVTDDAEALNYSGALDFLDGANILLEMRRGMDLGWDAILCLCMERITL